MRNIKITFLFLCMVSGIIFSGCGYSNEKKTEREIFAMDTVMKLTFYGDSGEEAMDEAVREIYRLDNLFSVTKEDSDISKINSCAGKAVSVSRETYELLKRCRQYSNETEGLFDISVYPLVKLWGFTTGDYRIPTKEEKQKTIKKIDYRKIEMLSGRRVKISKGMSIDLGAVAKGYLSQKLMELCKKSGVTSAIVSLGGNVQTIGVKEDGNPYTVGITNPKDGTGIYGTLTVKDKAVITSGTYQRNFTKNGKTYHHIMDKRTGMPADNGLASVTVIADDGEKADALATAFSVMGEQKARDYQKKHPEIEIILIRNDGSFWQSSGAGMERQ